VNSLLSPLAPQDHIPLGITWVASQLLEFITALLDPVLFHIIVIPKDNPHYGAGRGLQPLPSTVPHLAEDFLPPESRHIPCNYLGP
jgi:hypothetical protein